MSALFPDLLLSNGHKAKPELEFLTRNVLEACRYLHNCQKEHGSSLLAEGKQDNGLQFECNQTILRKFVMRGMKK